MAKELVYLCDLCLAQNEPRPATHVDVLIAIADAKPRQLDLCLRHHRELVQPLLDALDRHGLDPMQLPRKRHRQGWKRQIGPFLCRAGCNSAPHKTATTLEVHLANLHDLTLDEYVAQYGELTPLTEHELRELVVEVVCQITGCGQRYSTELGNRYPQQAMVSHMWGHHAIKWRPGEIVEQRQRERAAGLGSDDALSD